ncbi:MAG TPA: efflux RND transporter periplasmic adaptor subunit [Verrucomicrobiota bacterium]|nr:efflux RND transporter periplasmic adaptor subunit [Verrucomicrobiota bacterium]HNT16184.1 efflux RND transporter periplasmic adaptor subunit [Verrucomicrobiota bacterium]
MIKKIFAALIVVTFVVGGLAGVKVLQIRTLIAFGKSYQPPAEVVSTAVVKADQWRETLSAIGSIAAVQGTHLAAEVPGTVAEIHFTSGAVVAAGTVLLRLDTSMEAAQLRALEAQVAWAQTNLARYRNLRSDQTVSPAEFDQAETDLKQKQANADALRATLDKKVIRAPFAGRLGIRQVNLGEYVDAGKPLVSLQSLAPVYADFSLPQQELARLATGLPVRVTTDTYPDQEFAGTLTAINPDLDVATRSVRLQATCANEKELLRPGMFARVQVLLPDTRQALVIPVTAVLSAPFGDSVYVVESATNHSGGLVVRQQFVRLGEAQGDFVTVLNGLQAGERVVTSGVFKLRHGMAVEESREPAPSLQSRPDPADS